jgi:hypothetical protein
MTSPRVVTLGLLLCLASAGRTPAQVWHAVFGLVPLTGFDVYQDGHLIHRGVQSATSGIAEFTSDGGGDFQIVVSGVIGPMRAEPPPMRTALLGVFPNPTAGPLHVAFSLDSAAEVQVCLTDVSGRQIGRVRRGQGDRGRNSWALEAVGTDGRRLAAGSYFVVFRSGATWSSRRVIILPDP